MKGVSNVPFSLINFKPCEENGILIIRIIFRIMSNRRAVECGAAVVQYRVVKFELNNCKLIFELQ